MKNLFKKYILIMISLMSVRAFGYQILQNIPMVEGGIDKKMLAVCMRTVQQTCRTTRLTVKSAVCIQTVFNENKTACAQSNALYQATQGVIQRWRQFDKITVIQTSNASAESIGQYFMLTPQGQIVGLIAMPWVTAQPTAASRAEARFQIWPITLEEPNAYPVFSGGGNQIVFRQFLSTICKTCRPRGYVDVVYLFNAQGDYVKWIIRQHKMTEQ
jgi:hypothetical protein